MGWRQRQCGRCAAALGIPGRMDRAGRDFSLGNGAVVPRPCPSCISVSGVMLREQCRNKAGWRRQQLSASADRCWHGKDCRDSLSLLLRFFQAQSPANTSPCLSHLSQPCSSFPATSIFPWAAVLRTGSQGEPRHHKGSCLRLNPPSLSSSCAVTHLRTGRGQENGPKEVPR